MTVLSSKRHFRRGAGLLAAGIALASAVLAGCQDPRITNTARTAVEQMLLSDVIEQSTDQMKFEQYKGQKALMDYKYLDPQVDKPVVQGMVERRLAECGVVVTADAKEADIIIQVLCPVLATEMSTIFLGTPRFPFSYPIDGVNYISLQIIIPEIPLFKKLTRVGFARFSLNILKASDHTPLEIQRRMFARSEYVNWTVLLFPWSTNNIGIRESVPNDDYKYDLRLY